MGIVNHATIYSDEFDFEAATFADIHFVYHTATGELWGGRPVQTLAVSDAMHQLRWEVTAIGLPVESWNPESIEELFGLRAQRELRSVESLAGEITDLHPDRIKKIEEVIERSNCFYFYELAFEAKSKMVATDYIGALLLAVAALEGVHGAFASQVLKQRLPDGRTGEDKNLEDQYLKELGFSLCNKLTPYVLMDQNQRPSKELIEGVTTAVKYRNEIMHALRKPSGEYRIRTRHNQELCDAYSSTLKMYDVYRKALESEILKEQAGGTNN